MYYCYHYLFNFIAVCVSFLSFFFKKHYFSYFFFISRCPSSEVFWFGKSHLCLFSQSQANLMFHWTDSSWQMSWKSRRMRVPSLCKYGYTSVFSVYWTGCETSVNHHCFISHLRFSTVLARFILRKNEHFLNAGFGIFRSRPLLYGLVSYFVNRSDSPGKVFLRGPSLPPAASNKVPGSDVKKTLAYQ